MNPPACFCYTLHPLRVVKHVAFEAAIARNATIADLEHFEAEACLWLGSPVELYNGPVQNTYALTTSGFRLNSYT